MADKREADYTKRVDEAVLKAKDLAQKDVEAAVGSLKDIEKLTRIDADMKSNTRVVQYMVRLFVKIFQINFLFFQAKLCFEGQKWDLLMETIMTLSTKRRLIQIAIAEMVRDAVAMIEKMPSEELKMKLIETLRTVTAGKIYVEVEHARLTLMVVKKLEAEGKLDEAATMLLELQVETYGLMEMKEKVLYLLEQMRYSLVRNDYARATIISENIILNNIEFFNNSETEDVQDLKLKYYELMIRFGLHGGNYLDVCRHHLEIYETKKIKEDSVKATYHLCSAVVYCLLAPHTNEQWDLLNRIAIQRELETDYKDILNLFINQKLISFKRDIVAKYETLLRRGTADSPDTGIFDKSIEGEKRWSELQLRVADHSMKKIARDYTMITLERLSHLIGFSTDEIQTVPLNTIVRSYCMRILPNRPSQIVHLRWNQRTVEQLETNDTAVKIISTNINTGNSSSFLTDKFCLEYCFDVFNELSNGKISKNWWKTEGN
ncbi:hypothetical protein CRE_11090 [Caenorhabditis remanei]|uniref:PSMD12/CSN4-like N-terminal domain-containing protein n=1 Tax=Caenorhabditis remanei TaxID=31234 RepID=E3M5G9_CAERE|nr:hypothetical protein CRE_11090 [Caenorhabditis remanei]